MKLNGGPPNPPASDPALTRPGGTAPAAPARDPSGAALVPTRIDPALSAQQQLAQLKLANRETVMARVAEILQQKGAGAELLLELRGRTLAVATGTGEPDVQVGDLIRVMRVNNTLQLLGKLGPGENADISRLLAQRLPWQQNLQAGLAQLLSTLNTGVKATLQPGQLPSATPIQPLPAPVQQALQSLLQQIPGGDALARNATTPMLSASPDAPATTIRHWLAESGTFAESRLLQTGTQPPADLKLALTQVVARLLAAEGQGAEAFKRLTPASSADLLQAPLQFPRFGTPAVPTQSAEPVTVGQMLRLLAGMLNRITVNQLHAQSLNTRAGAEPGAPINTLLMELPFLNPQQEPRVAQLRLEHYEREASSSDQPNRASVSEWRLSLTMDLDEAGALHFDVSLRLPAVSALVWAEKQDTLRRVNESLPKLRDSLTELGLDIEELACRRGTPQRTETRLEHRLVDTRA